MALQLIKEENTYASAFRELIETRAVNEPSWLRLLRQKSFDRFESVGYPSVKEEDWKYTNVTPIAKANFAPVLSSNRTTVTASDLQPLSHEETRNSSLVFLNGRYRKDLSDLQALPADAVVLSFSEGLTFERHAAVIRQHFEHYAGDSENGFTALNTAFAEGVLIVVPANTTVEKPIHLLFVSESNKASAPASFPRVLVVAEENSNATIVETHASLTGGKYLTNAVVDLTIEHGANLHHYKVQRESTDAFHIAATTADLGAGATYDTTTINFGAAISRHGIEVRMDHEGAQCSVDGLYMVDGKQHTDTHSVIDHRQPRCSSHQLYKGILDGKSRAVFNGKVFVRHGAQQTDARQTNKNLLLSPEAHVDTKPQLEIFADDVKCAHGAAVGQLDLEELFYLESRGINPTLARNMLTYGFAEEVIEKIKIGSIKRELDEAVLHRLRAALELE
jgi:Fe-S cluster assembly protein SufD